MRNQRVFLSVIWRSCLAEEIAFDLGGISRGREKGSQVKGTERA